MRVNLTVNLTPGRLKLARVTDIKPAGIPWRVHRDSARGWPCPYCWVIMSGHHSAMTCPTWDHVIPTSRGGSNDAANVIPVCQSCNRNKADRDPATWLGALRHERSFRVRPVTRFLEIVMEDWSEPDRAMMWDIVDKAQHAAAQLTQLRAADAGRNLRKVLPFRIDTTTHVSFSVPLSDMQRAHNVLSSLGIPTSHWTWRGHGEVGVIINSRSHTLKFHDEAQFRSELIGMMQGQMMLRTAEGDTYH